jgi:hypothetical protein
VLDCSLHARDGRCNKPGGGSLPCRLYAKEGRQEWALKCEASVGRQGMCVERRHARNGRYNARLLWAG